MSIRKILCLLLIAALSLSGATFVFAEEETLTFSMYVDKQGDDSFPYTEWPSYEAMMEASEKYLGKKIEIELTTLPWSEYNERMSVYVASGDMHDVFFSNGDHSIVNDLAEGGDIVNLLDYKDLLVNIMPIMDQNNNLDNALGYENGLWGFPYLQHSSTAGSQWVWAVRVDVMEELGLKVPATMDELYDVLVALKEKYPDSYPMDSSRANRGYGIPAVMMACFSVGDSVYYNGEKFVYGPFDYEDRFKAAIEYTKKLYDEGLLQPEFFTQTYDALPSRAMNDQTFMIPNDYTQIITQNYTSEDYPDVVWGIMPYPAGVEDDAPWKMGSNKLGYSFQYTSLLINSNADNIEDLIKLFDYQYSEEMIDISNWGIQGESYNIDENGEKVWSDEVLSLSGQERMRKVSEWGVIGSGYGYPNPFPTWTLDWDARGSLWDSMPAWDGEAFTEPANIVAYYGETNSQPVPDDYAPPVELRMTDEEKDFVNRTISAYDTTMEEGMIQLITGVMSMDDWDQYMANIASMGDMEEVLNIYNKYVAEFK